MRARAAQFLGIVREPRTLSLMSSFLRRLKPRTWRQFSLRGLLIVITLACTWLGLETRRATRQREAIIMFKDLGGDLTFERRFGRNEKSDKEVHARFANEFFRDVVSVNFGFNHLAEVTDRQMAAFDALPSVNMILLHNASNNVGVSDEGIRHLGGLSKLKVLSLGRTRVAGPGLRHLPRGIVSLHLTHSPIDDEGLVYLRGMKNLKTLDIDHTGISDAGLAQIADLVSLESLNLRGTLVTDQGLEQLASLKSLNVLYLWNTDATSRGVARLEKALPK
jgi:hypothetical protein